MKGSHPDLYDRMTRAGHPPSWPRPEPPARSRASTLLLLAGTLFPLLLFVADPGSTEHAASPGEVLLVRAQDVALVRIARHFGETGRQAEARELLNDLAARTPTMRLPVMGAAAELGFCDDAAALLQAEDSGSEDPWAVWAFDRLQRCRPR